MALTKLRLLWIDGEERSGKIFLLFCGCRKWITLEWIYYKNPKNSFCAAFCPKTPVQGFYYNSILGLYSYYFKFIKKIRKDPCIHFSETCKTSIWAYFVLQTSKQFFRVNFKTSYYYNFIQKKKQKKGLVQSPQYKTFPRKVIQVNCELIYIYIWRYCNNVRLFSKIIKNTFFYFAYISQAFR